MRVTRSPTTIDRHDYRCCTQSRSNQDRDIKIVTFSSSGTCITSAMSTSRRGARWKVITWPFSGTSQLSLGDPKVLTPSGSYSVRDRARVRRNTSWNTDKHRPGGSLHRRHYHMIARSLARSPASSSPSLLHCHHPRIWQWCEGTPMYASVRNCYFGLDKDGEAETPKDSSSTAKKKNNNNGLTCILLNPRASFPRVFERKIHHVRAICLYTRCLFCLFTADLFAMWMCTEWTTEIWK